MPKKLLTFLAVGLLCIPIGFFLLFTFGEVFSGDLSGLSHVLQLIPFVVILWLVYKVPHFAGWTLVVGSLLLGLLYAVDGRLRPEVWMVELFLFVPPFLAGAFLLLAQTQRQT